MNRRFSIATLFIALTAVFGSTCSCTSEDEPSAALPEVEIVVNAEVELSDTKTYIEEKTVLWGKGEKMKFALYSQDAKSAFATSAATDVFDGKATAAFSFSITPQGTAPYILCGLYPAEAAVENANPADFKVKLPQVQNATATSYDPSAFIMVARPEVVTEVPKQWTAYYRRAVALNKVTLKNIDKDIDSVKVTFPSGKYVTGRRKFNLTTGESLDLYYGKREDVSVRYATPLTGGADMDIWFATWGVDVPMGGRIVFTAYATDGSVFTRTITAPEGGLSFKEGYLNTISVRMVIPPSEGGDDVDESDAGPRNPGWLELPTYTGADDYILTYRDDLGARNYTHYYDSKMYTSIWTAYPLYAGTIGGSRSGSWSVNPNIVEAEQINCWDASYNVCYGDTEFVTNAAETKREYYSRGHQIPDGDRSANATMQAQTYYVSNSTPQIQNKFNAGIWQQLEGAIRDVAAGTDTIYVVTGAAFQKVGGSESVTWITPKGDPDRSCPVPNYYWKVLLKVKWSDGVPVSAAAAGFWFAHREYSGESYTSYATSVDEIESFTGFNFFPNLPLSLQTTSEASSKWTAFQNF